MYCATKMMIDMNEFFICLLERERTGRTLKAKTRPRMKREKKMMRESNAERDLRVFLWLSASQTMTNLYV